MESSANPLLDDPLLRDVPTVQGFKFLAPTLLFRRVGQGGFGCVYQARHLTFAYPFDCAVKCLQGSDHTDRFAQEAKLGAELTDPNLVKVFHVGRSAGLHYLVMEWVDGETVTARTRRAPQGMAPEEAVEIARQAARGLAALHRSGVVHRDIKPDNLMIDLKGVVKVADLGIAKRQTTEQEGFTSPGHGIGTLRYMAPEQHDGSPELGPSADVFSLGATMFRMLAGRDGLSGSHLDILRVLTTDGFPRLATLRPDLPAELTALVDRCTRTAAGERFADGAALLAALEALGMDECALAFEHTDVAGLTFAGTDAGPSAAAVATAAQEVESGLHPTPQPGATESLPSRTAPMPLGGPHESASVRPGRSAGQRALIAAGGAVGLAVAVVAALQFGGGTQPDDGVGEAVGSRDGGAPRPANSADDRSSTPSGPTAEGLRARLDGVVTQPPIGARTAADQVELRGLPGANEGLELTADGQPVAAVDGRATVPLAPDGILTLALRSSNGAEVTRPLQYRVDRAGPAIDLSALGEVAPVGPDRTTTVAVAGLVDADAVRVTVRGGPSGDRQVAADRGRFGFDVELRAGRHALELVAVDDLGNEGPPAELTVEVPARFVPVLGLRVEPLPAEGDGDAPEERVCYVPEWGRDLGPELEALRFVRPSDEHVFLALTELTHGQLDAIEQAVGRELEPRPGSAPTDPVGGLCLDATAAIVGALNDLRPDGARFSFEVPTVDDWRRFARANAGVAGARYPYAGEDHETLGNYRPARLAQAADEESALGEGPTASRDAASATPALVGALAFPQGLTRIRSLAGNLQELCRGSDGGAVALGGGYLGRVDSAAIEKGVEVSADRRFQAFGLRVALRSDS